MSSLLSFAYRTQNNNDHSHSDAPHPSKNDDTAESPVPLVVTTTQSGETCSDEDGLKNRTIQVVVPNLPSTPEGLRRRRSAAEIRNELNLPASSTYDRSWPMTSSGVLPPRPSSSWSTEGLLSSPPPSQRAPEGVAESPQLMPGHARTAVGAIVALQSPQLWNRGGPEDHQSWAEQRQGVDNENEAARADGVYCRGDVDRVESNRTPFRLTAKPWHASPNVESTKESMKPPPNLNNSFVSYAASTRVVPKNRDGSFRHDPVSGRPDRTAAANLMPPPDTRDQSFSGISLPVPTINRQHVDDDQFYRQRGATMFHVHNQNQRRVKEELVLAALERLQDNVELVVDVSVLIGAAISMGNSSKPTPKDEEGLLTGMSKQSRKTAMRMFSSILDEMDTAAPEEFFLSPSQLSEYAETHDDLREALLFCRTVVGMAIPEMEKDEATVAQGQWKLAEGMRLALGFIPPESPENVRGGDTSVFSLPEDTADTPMTSNVSMTTTITSCHSPSKESRVNKAAMNGLQVRRTIECFSSIFQRLSSACNKLSEGNGDRPNLGVDASIRLTEEVKRNYLQLLAIETDDIKALVDAFILDIAPPKITRAVSHEAGDMPGVYLPPSVARASMFPTVPPSNFPTTYPLVLPPPPARPSIRQVQEPRHASALFSPSTDDMRTWHENESLGRTTADDNRENLFSPGTDDMRTYTEKDCGMQEFDDLRRTVGSNDYDDEEERRDGFPVDDDEREGPPSVGSRPPASKKMSA